MPTLTLRQMERLVVLMRQMESHYKSTDEVLVRVNTHEQICFIIKRIGEPVLFHHYKWDISTKEWIKGV